MSENQYTICRWADSTFGQATLTAAHNRLMKEAVELEAVVLDPASTPERIIEECADVLITLYRVAGLTGRDLMGAVDDKMSINRARIWRLNGDGTTQHVEGA
tara:strand:- start:1098 stop:1403 length:306 start_codon:yes stop_codon:yes gene_type:complete